MRNFSLMVLLALLTLSASAIVPQYILDEAQEMQELGCRVSCGVSDADGLYMVSIGTAEFRRGQTRKSQASAEQQAKKQIAEALGMSIKAKDVAGMTMVSDGDKTMVKATISSFSESQVEQLLKGVALASAGPNEDKTEMRVVMYLTAKVQDATSELDDMMKKYGDKGVVEAIGIAAEQPTAEKYALRSAVEQVAGTMVVGKVTTNEQDDLHERLSTTAGALVEEYRVKSVATVDSMVHETIVARVNKRKLYDSYKAYFKCLDNPSFYIVATDPSLKAEFAQYFIDKGMDVVEKLGDATYQIMLDGKYTDRPTPGVEGSMGTQIYLEIKVTEIGGKGRILMDITEKQSKDSNVLTAQQRRAEISRRILKKVDERLHQKIHELVIQLLDEADSNL